MTDPLIRRIWPGPGIETSDDDLVDLYSVASNPALAAGGHWLRVNMIASVDGAGAVGGRSGGLGAAADRRVFDLLRRLADVIVVGAGTVRDEGYSSMRLDDAARNWRVAHGFAPHPVFAIVSRSLDLDPESAVFTDAPVRPILLVSADVPERHRELFASRADVIVSGDSAVDASQMIGALVDRSLRRIHCEGGPSLLGDLIAAHCVDELCLSISPILVAGRAPRISGSRGQEVFEQLTLGHVLESDGMLLTRYVRRA